MKNKRLKLIPPTNKKRGEFRLEEYLNYLKPVRRAFAKDLLLSEGPPEAKGNDNDFRERYRI